MPTPKLAWATLLLGPLFMAGCCLPASAASPTAGSPAAAHDGTHDFDFELGYWHIHLKKLLYPLSRAHDWVEYDGTTRTLSLWGGGPPNIGEFKTGVGYFYCWDTYNGRYILERFEWSRTNTKTPHFEQSFSED